MKSIINQSSRNSSGAAVPVYNERGFLMKDKAVHFSSVADPHHLDADPDPTFHFAADPDPNPDTNLQINAQNLEKVLK
jgi:hypothetical protein